MAFTSQYRAQHTELLGIAQKINTMMASPGQVESQAAEIRMLMAKLSGLLRVHLSLEDRALYPRLTRSQNPTTRSVAERFVKEMGGIAEVFAGYMNKYKTAQAISSAAPQFITDTKALFAALGDRIRRENDQLYPLADTAA